MKSKGDDYMKTLLKVLNLHKHKFCFQLNLNVCTNYHNRVMKSFSKQWSFETVCCPEDYCFIDGVPVNKSVNYKNKSSQWTLLINYV